MFFGYFQQQQGTVYLLLHQEVFLFFPTEQMKLGLKEISRTVGENHQILSQFPIEETQVKLEKLQKSKQTFTSRFDSEQVLRSFSSSTASWI